MALTREGLEDEEVHLRAQLIRVSAFQLMYLPSTSALIPQTHTQQMKQTFLPSKKNINVGVTLTPHSPATLPPIPTFRSVFENARPSRAFSRASPSNTGSITLHGGHVSGAVKNATSARWEWSRERREDGFVDRWMGAVRVCVAGVGEPFVAGVGVPFVAAREATAWRRAEASWGLGDADAAAGEGVAGAAPGAGRRYILSIVGRRAAPNGVERKSAGRSTVFIC